MEFSTSVTFFLLLFFQCSIFLPAPLTIASNLMDEGGDYNYIPGSGKGPESWGDLKQEWRICKIGQNQFPVDISSRVTYYNQSMGRLDIGYKPSPAIMENRGHDITIKWPNDTGSLSINGKGYVLQQLHWHFPAEHTLNGFRAPLEMHMVHQSSDQEIAVIGVLFYTSRKHDPFLSPQLMEHLKELVGEKDVGPLKPPVITPELEPYYRYRGSLTTPPCSEGVFWTVLQKKRPVSNEQLRMLKAAVHNQPNARPIQLLNGRSISLYRPSRDEDSEAPGYIKSQSDDVDED